MNALDEASVLAGFDDERPIVRWHALKCAESLCNQAPAVLHAMSRMADDDDIRVRYQLAFSIGAALAGTKNETLAKLAIQDVNNSWMQIAILSSLGGGADKVLVTLASNEAFVANKNGMTLLKELCSQIGLRNRPHEVSAVINTISENDKLSSPLIESLVSKVQGTAREQLLALTSNQANEVLMKLVESASTSAMDTTLTNADRVRAIENLQLASFEDTSPMLEQLLSVNEAFQVKAAAINTLSEYTDAGVASILIRRWPTMGPTLRMRAAEALLSRNKWTELLLNAVENGQVGRG